MKTIFDVREPSKKVEPVRKLAINRLHLKLCKSLRCCQRNARWVQETSIGRTGVNDHSDSFSITLPNEKDSGKL